MAADCGVRIGSLSATAHVRQANGSMYTIEANSLTSNDVAQLNRLTADLGRGKPLDHPWAVYEQINNNAAVFVARSQADGELAGLGILNIDYKTPPPFFGNLQSLAVLPEHRGNGAFSRLMDAIEQRARELELGIVALQCSKHRHRVAFKAYKARGYRELVPLSGIMIGKPHKLGAKHS